MILDINSGHARTILRVYFTVITIFVGLIGNSCCGLRTQLGVVRRQHVALSQMTGWLKGWDLVFIAWKLKALPGGWISLLMTVVTALALTSDLAVAGLVKSIQVPSRCEFGRGLVINKANGSLLRPSPNGAPVHLIMQAQMTSANNTGLEGIYKKVNNATTFRADQQDTLGAWTCADQGILKFDAAYSPKNIVDALYSKGYLFTDAPGNEVTSTSSASNFFNEVGKFDHLVLWDSSQVAPSDGTFEVRASIDMTPQMNTSTQMWSFRCTMNATDAEYISSSMASQRVLGAWAPYLQGSVYDGAGTTAWPNSGQIIGRLLNTMTMVAGGLNSLQSSPLTSSNIDTTQGCLAYRTIVPTAVIAMVLALASISFFLLCFYIYLKASLRIAIRSSGIDAAAKARICETPNDLVDWMAHAVRETATGGVIKARNVKTWNFGLDSRGYGLFGLSSPTTQDSHYAHLNPGGSEVEFGHINTYSRMNYPAN